MQRVSAKLPADANSASAVSPPPRIRISSPSASRSLRGCGDSCGCRRRSGLLRPAKLPVGATVPIVTAASLHFIRTVKWNRVPRPTSLSSQILPPIMRNQPRGDGQAEASAAVFARGGGVRLREWIKYSFCFSAGCRFRCRTLQSAASDVAVGSSHLNSEGHFAAHP